MATSYTMKEIPQAPSVSTESGTPTISSLELWAEQLVANTLPFLLSLRDTPPPLRDIPIYSITVSELLTTVERLLVLLPGALLTTTPNGQVNLKTSGGTDSSSREGFRPAPMTLKP